jgi:hypothetical protein
MQYINKATSKPKKTFKTFEEAGNTMVMLISKKQDD